MFDVQSISKTSNDSQEALLSLIDETIFIPNDFG
jgi:hypothetical protein